MSRVVCHETYTEHAQVAKWQGRRPRPALITTTLSLQHIRISRLQQRSGFQSDRTERN